MIIGFAVFWPLGLAMLAWIIWGEEIAAKAEDAEGAFPRPSPSARQRFRAATRPCLPAAPATPPSTNTATQELKRLDEERRKLEAMRAEFESFLAELRRVKDQEEFDRFMREFRNRTDGRRARPPT